MARRILTQHLALPALQLADLISQAGWLRLQATSLENLEQDIRDFANILGTPAAGRDGRILERLTPQDTVTAKAKSLSVIHGLGSFPLHTDGAHRARPPRFLLLACIRPGILPVPTLLQRFSDLRLTVEQRGLCSTATFLIKNGRRSFYSTIAGDRPYIRFDEGCMGPSTALAKKFSMPSPQVKLGLNHQSFIGGRETFWRLIIGVYCMAAGVQKPMHPSIALFSA